jgi:hypothetical protein
VSTETVAVKRPGVPKIRLFSLAGIESIGWAVVIGHIVKWAVDFWYFAVTQVGWGFMYPLGQYHTWWYMKRVWDHLPHYVGKFFNLLGVHASWVAWLMSKHVDESWTEPRHLARGVLIGLIAGVIITFMFQKPSRPDTGQDPSGFRYAITPLMAIIYAIPGIAVVAVLVHFVPWLQVHGLSVPGSSALANEANGWVAAGAWVGTLMGLLGSQFFAKYASRWPADSAQWFFAERSAAKLKDDTGLNRLRTRVWGTPQHRVRVHYLLDTGAEVVEHSVWAVRVLLFGAAFTIISSGIGAWLTLAGPAAGAH